MMDQRRICPGNVRLLPDSDRDAPKAGDRGHGTGGRDRHSSEPGKTIRVLIAGGRGLSRAGYRALLQSEERIEVIGEAADGRRAIALATATRPDVVLLDAGRPGFDVAGTIAAIASQATGTAVMLIVPREADDSVVKALEAGAAGVLQNDAESDDLIWAVQVLAHGYALLSVGTMRGMLARRPPQSHRSRSEPSQLQELTAREREVMALAASGLRNWEIAELLVISPKTAKTHISRAMGKLGAHHRAQLVILAYEAGLVPARGDEPCAQADLLRLQPPEMVKGGTRPHGTQGSGPPCLGASGSRLDSNRA
jgi:DNA-binding NarL/FixJ family response regulator